ncbi:MAG: hypothetical protein A2Y97_12620 [Nitrospirae bacterium RBG_13_39_12]|nr:MAG: hypothetical protein A2Y97_12620 [Nitrospirae bacterium RBG_13_39_12]
MLKEKYGDKIRYFYKENSGCAIARNYGISVARGKYIAFLDSDDKYLPEKLNDQVEMLDNNRDLGFVSGDIFFFDASKRYLIKMIRPDGNGHIAYPLFMFTYFSLCASMFRKSCFDKVGYFNETMRYNEDTDMLLRIALNFRAGFSNNPTFLYRKHEEGKSTNRIKLLDAVFESSVNMLNFYPDFKVSAKKICKRLGQIKLDLSMEYVLKRDFLMAIKELRLSLIQYPSLRKRLYMYLFGKRWIQRSIVCRVIAYFEQIIMKGLQWRIYKYTGWIL